MSRHIRLSIEGATDTTCGACALLRDEGSTGYCPMLSANLKYTVPRGSYERDPACIEAERADHLEQRRVSSDAGMRDALHQAEQREFIALAELDEARARVVALELAISNSPAEGEVSVPFDPDNPDRPT